MSLEKQLEGLLREIRELKEWRRLPTLLTPKRAAAELSISVRKLLGHVAQGDILASRIGPRGRPMIPADEVLRIARPKAAPRPSPAKPPSRRPRGTGSVDDELRKVDAALRSRRKKS